MPNQSHPPTVEHPRPTNGIEIPENMEDGSTKDLKKAWFEATHSSAPETDWRRIELENTYHKYNNRNLYKGPNSVSLGNSHIEGFWEEKGSKNQAGSMLATAYNKVTDKIVAISDGGSLWESDLNGDSWVALEDQLRFDGRFLDVVYPTNGRYRLITSIGGVPYYQESTEQIWVRAVGVEESSIPKTKNQLIIQDGRKIFYLSQSIAGAPVELMYSDDYGSSYRNVRTLTARDLKDVAIAKNPNGQELFLIEEKSGTRSDIYIFQEASENLTLLTFSSSIGFGQYGKANLQVYKANGITQLYVYDAFNNLKTTTNNGLTWSTLSTLPITPWDVGLMVSPSDPNVMVIGGIEAYISRNGGATFTKVNDWGRYYEDILINLHADIMYVKEIQTNNDGPVLLISNHGGISKSSDKGSNFLNIGTEGLNTSQYYSVKTSPINENFIFAGSQDQGIQKAIDLGEGAVDFKQLKAGDYGHLQFTNYGRSLWAIYPGGNMYYYPDPIQSEVSQQPFDLLLNNPSVWIPPIITSPYNPNAVLIAGGSLINTTGSYIVDVSIDNFSQIFGTQWPFDFSVSGGDISALAYNHEDKNEFYALTTNGKFYKSTNRGAHFQQKTTGLTDAHHLYGNTILTSHLDKSTILIGGSGYDNPAVFISYDSGESFEPMVDGLPPTTVFQMVYDPEEQFIFAATEAGPYVYIKNEGIWKDLSEGQAPNLRYWSVEFLPNSSKVRFGTYGRGIWDFNLKVLTDTKDLVTDIQTINIYPNPATEKATVKFQQSIQQATVQIISTTGQVMNTLNLVKVDELTIDVSDYADGVYYLIFDNGNKVSSSIIIKA